MNAIDGRTTLTDDQLERMLDRAALRGACEALKAIGLEDQTAGSDIRELRTLLTAWRETRRTAWLTTVKAITGIALTALALGLMSYLNNNGGR